MQCISSLVLNYSYYEISDLKALKYDKVLDQAYLHCV
jgi:hypothetical protein